MVYDWINQMWTRSGPAAGIISGLLAYYGRLRIIIIIIIIISCIIIITEK